MKNRVNDQIRISPVMVVDSTGKNLGVISLDQAKKLARDVELDLVEVAAQSRPPVCRIMDYGKFKYEQSVKDKKRHHKNSQLKEIRLRPNIGEHDLDVKIKKITEFLEDGDKVQVRLRFKGNRELSHKDLGFAIIDKILKAVENIGTFVKPRFDMGSIFVTIDPKKND